MEKGTNLASSPSSNDGGKRGGSRGRKGSAEPIERAAPSPSSLIFQQHLWMKEGFFASDGILKAAFSVVHGWKVYFLWGEEGRGVLQRGAEEWVGVKGSF